MEFYSDCRMCRPIKSGLSYFPLNTDVFENRKIQRLVRMYGSEGFAVYTVVLCDIYRQEGYYMNYDAGYCVDIAFVLNMPENEAGRIREIIAFCVQVNLFDRELLERHGVLTSLGIQLRYREVRKRGKARMRHDLLLMCPPDGIPDADENVADTDNGVPDADNEVCVAETGVSAAITPVSVAITPVSAAITATEGKEKKKENKRENKKKGRARVPLSPPSPLFPEWVMDYFNTRFSGRLPLIAKMTPRRASVILARAADYGEESVKSMLDNVANSPFLLGENTRRWHACFDWLFKPDNFVKVLEGNYLNAHKDEKNSGSDWRSAQRKQEIMRMATEAAARDCNP